MWSANPCPCIKFMVYIYVLLYVAYMLQSNTASVICYILKCYIFKMSHKSTLVDHLMIVTRLYFVVYKDTVKCNYTYFETNDKITDKGTEFFFFKRPKSLKVIFHQLKQNLWETYYHFMISLFHINNTTFDRPTFYQSVKYITHW